MSACEGATVRGPSVDGVKTEEDDDEFFDGEDDDEVYETMDDAPMKVQDGLFIGSFMSEQNERALQSNGITHVLQVADGMQPSHPDTFKYKTIHVQDMPSEDLVAHFTNCFEFIDGAASQGGAVLVHCLAGVSRSATVCIGYMMWKHHISYDEAFKRLHSVRPWVMPNEGFKQQLAEFQKLGYDLTKWKAWRHTWPEDPMTILFSSTHGQVRSTDELNL